MKVKYLVITEIILLIVLLLFCYQFFIKQDTRLQYKIVDVSRGSLNPDSGGTYTLNKKDKTITITNNASCGGARLNIINLKKTLQTTSIETKVSYPDTCPFLGENIYTTIKIKDMNQNIKVYSINNGKKHYYEEIQ